MVTASPRCSGISIYATSESSRPTTKNHRYVRQPVLPLKNAAEAGLFHNGNTISRMVWSRHHSLVPRSGSSVKAATSVDPMEEHS